MKRVFVIAAVMGLALSMMASAGLAEEERNDGQDPTRPLTRMDIRMTYDANVDIPMGKDADQLVTILRIDKPIPLMSTAKEGGGGPWVFYYRTDLPIVASDVPSADNVNANWEVGIGDWFHQFIMISPKVDFLGISNFGFGAQLILDTASQDQFGTGQFRIVPLIAWKWTILKNVIPGVDNVSVIPIFKFDQELGFLDGTDGGPEVQNFQFKPQINIKLPHRWFVTLYETADIILQLSDDSRDKKDWSVPIDVMVGKVSNNCALVKQCVYSLNYTDFIVDDFRKNDWSLQFRMGLFF